MNEESNRQYVQPGDLVVLVDKSQREFLRQMVPGTEFQTDHGVVSHDEVIGKRWGEIVLSHIGYGYMILPPSMDQLIRSIQRATQIIYPKEIGYIIMKMNIGPGTRIIEAGTGSGGLTLALARMVRTEGHVYTYEARADIQALAERNMARVGLTPWVTFRLRDIAEGFDEEGVDALFLDVREPWRYLEHVKTALKGGGFFGSLLPTTNQVTMLLRGLEMSDFGFIEVEELLLRPYKPVPGRLRPADRMIAHTGFLVFARSLINKSLVPGRRRHKDEEDEETITEVDNGEI